MNQFDANRNADMLCGALAKKGYMRWWHSFSGVQPDSGEIRTFFVEYFIVNPSLGDTQPILAQHPYFRKRNMKPSYVMIKAGVFPDENGEGGKQLHAYFPISALRAASEPLYMEIENCVLSENRLLGYITISKAEARHKSLMTDAGNMEWDLEVNKAIACHTGAIAGKLATALHALDSFWHGEGIKTQFRGRVVLDGVPYEVTPEQCHGYADKHWGRSFNKPWFQLASCCLISERTGKPLHHSAFAIDGCSPTFFGLPLRRKLMMQLTYTGEDFEFHFARPFSASRCKWNVKQTNKRFIWHILAQNKTAVVKISGCCKKNQMMPLYYESPDGIVPKSLPNAGSNGIGTIEIYRLVPGGRQLVDRLTVSNTLCIYGNDF